MSVNTHAVIFFFILVLRLPSVAPPYRACFFFFLDFVRLDDLNIELHPCVFACEGGVHGVTTQTAALRFDVLRCCCLVLPCVALSWPSSVLVAGGWLPRCR